MFLCLNVLTIVIQNVYHPIHVEDHIFALKYSSKTYLVIYYNNLLHPIRANNRVNCLMVLENIPLGVKRLY